MSDEETVSSVEEPKPVVGGNSSLKILLPVLAVLAAVAVWAFMPSPVDPLLGKLGKVSDQGQYYAIEYPGDMYSAVEAVESTYPDLAEPDPRNGPGALAQSVVLKDGVREVEISVGTKTSTMIRYKKQPNYARFRGH